MADRRPGAGALAWAALAAVLAAAALLAWPLDRTVLDWQPGLVVRQPWRAWSAVFVHYSALHLGANIAGAVLVALLGVVTRLPMRATVAWLLAWPLTQLGLLAQPQLLHYGGLSGVLHAGVAVAAVHVLVEGTRAQRLIAGALVAGLALKIAGEAPWRHVLVRPEGWDIAIAPLAHLTGAVSGAITAIACELPHRLRAPTMPR